MTTNFEPCTSAAVQDRIQERRVHGRLDGGWTVIRTLSLLFEISAR